MEYVEAAQSLILKFPSKNLWDKRVLDDLEFRRFRLERKIMRQNALT
jgi:hypothetical protein